MSTHKALKVAGASISAAMLALSFLGTPAIAAEPPHNPSTKSITPVQLSKQQTRDVISKAKLTDPVGFENRRNTISQSDAFMEVLHENVASPDQALDFFAAISTDEQAQALVRNTAGKRFIISGTASEPSAQLVPSTEATLATPLDFRQRSVQPMAMPKCGKAWAAFSAWLAGTTMVCAPFSGPAAWGCAIAMGFLGLMPDFNAACDK